jgi:hypothetical protein
MVFPPRHPVSRLELAFWLSGPAVPLPSSQARATTLRRLDLLFSLAALTQW